MTRAIARPYRAVNSDAIRVREMLVITGDGDPLVDPEEVVGWSPEISLDIRVTIDVDRDVIEEETGVAASHLAFGLVWACNATQIRDRGPAVGLNAQETVVAANVPGRWLRSRLAVQVVCFVQTAASALVADPLVPTTPGLLVWESSPMRLWLEGSGEQFPMVACSFKNSGEAGIDQALWRLVWTNTYLSAPFSGCVVIEINTDNPRGKAILEDPDSPAGVAAASAIAGGVARQLIERALSDDEFSLDEDYGDDSLGASLQALVRWLGHDLSQVKMKFHDDKPATDALIQSRFGV